MFARARRASLALFSAAALGKAALTTLNDDWDDVAYAASRLPQRALALALGPASSSSSSPSARRKPRVVVLGSGWGALSFIRKLDQDAVDLTIVSPRPFFFYTPLLAGTATGTVSHGSIVEPIRWYCERAGHGGAAYVQAEVADIDPAAKRVTCAITSAAAAAGPAAADTLALEYDYLVVAVGAEPATFGIPGVREHARFIKEVEDGIAIQRELLQKLELASALEAAAAAQPARAPALRAEVARLLSWVVIGGGPTGVELTAELTDFLRADVARYFPALAPRVRVTLVEAADRLLGVFDPALSASAAAALARLGAVTATNTAVTRITAEAVEVKTLRGEGAGSARAIPYGTVVWAGGIARRPIVAALAQRLDPAGAAQTSRHGLVVDPWLRVTGSGSGAGGAGEHCVFALGDCAVSGCAPTAQAAVQQGRFLGRAFRDALPALATEQDPSAPIELRLRPVDAFAFQPRGALAYTGGGTGVAELKNLWDVYPAAAAGSGGGGAGSGSAQHAAKGASGTTTIVDGTPAFAIWRSLYFSSILSTSNQARVLFDWAMAALFGRDISTPFLEGSRRVGSGGSGSSSGSGAPPALPPVAPA